MQLLGIAIKSAPRAQMQAMHEVRVDRETGIEDDCCGGFGRDGKRQVTLISDKSWYKACRDIGEDLHWMTRRANLYVAYKDFGPDDVGRFLTFGQEDKVILEITGECDPCSRMDDAHPGLREALSKDWRGGVTCRVVQGGILYCMAPMWFQAKAA